MKTQYLFFIILFLTGILQGQQHIAEYDKIPLYIFPWSLDSNTTQNRIQSMKDMGGDGVIAQEVRAILFDRLNNAGLRIVPYNTIPDSPYVNYIAKYTDASYTEWEAEGTDTAVGKVTLAYKNAIGEVINEGGITWVRTISGAGKDTLLKGPGYFQSPHYIIEPGDNTQRIREYEARYILKMDTNPLLSQDSITQLESEDDTVCILRVTYNPHPMTQPPITIDSLILEISDLKPYNSIKSKIISYNLEGLQESITKTLSTVKDNFAGSIAARYVEFRIEWKGLNYVRLWVDQVITSDDRGRSLIEFKEYDRGIRWQANDSLFAYPVDKYDSTIVGWYAVDEPSNIDNCDPLKYVDSLIRSATNGTKQLVVSLAGNFSGWFESDNPAPSESVYRVEELSKRSKVKSVMLNFYPYNLPWREKENPEYKSDNLIHLTECHLKVINKIDTLFWSSIQTGKWLYYDILNNLAGPDKVPTVAQYLYQINLSLLYGSKGIILNNYYYGNNELIISLYNVLTDEKHYLWYTTRDTISPRLKGLYGITLRNILQSTQIPNTDITYTSAEINRENLKRISKDAEYDGAMFLDVGLFAGSNLTKYFMLLNRYYSEYTGIRVSLMGLSGYHNWTVKEYRDTTYKFITTSTDTSSFVDIIGKGDAKLYSVRPSVKYGGEINHNETVTSETLIENDLTINSGKTLTVMGTYNCYKNIIVNLNGKLDIRPGSTLNFYDGAKLIVNGSLIAKGKNYNDSLITIDFQSPDDSTKNSVQLNPGSIDTISYCLIQNGYYGITADSVQAYITDNEITDCVDGIYVTDSYYMVDMAEGMRIDNNNINRNAENGISLSNSFPLIQGNIITRNSTGVYCEDNSGPLLCNLYDVGLNNIYENDNGLYSYDSSPLLGSEYPEFYGYNAVVGYKGAENEVFAMGGSYIMGENCFWGDYPPNPNHFFVDNTSSFDYDPALDFNPFGGNGKVKLEEDIAIEPKNNIQGIEGNPGLTTKEKYSTAMKKFISGDKISAKALLRETISEEPDSAVSLASIRLLMRMAENETEKDSLIQYLYSIVNSNENKEISVYAKLRMAEISRGDYISALNFLLSSYPGTNYKLYIKYKKFGYYLNEKGDKESAGSILSEMTAEYPEHRLTREAKKRLGTIISLNKGNSEETKGEELSYKLENNYPNPFNPETVIRYQIPLDGRVILKVYDILGREAATLVNEEQTKGSHKVIFNASRLSSGVYIYRITAGDFMMSKKMMLIK